MSEITAGKTVRLKSGGPNMTVEQVGKKSYAAEGDPDHAWCQWFDKTKLMTGVFPVTSLTVVD